MIAVITGDIIKSRKVNSEIWLPDLERYFSEIIDNSSQWEIFRGDSFQLEISVDKALEVALCIRAIVKSNNLINVRISIGLGTKNFQGKTILESNGTAFHYSGDGLTNMKFRTLCLKSSMPEFDSSINTMLDLVSFISSAWKPITAQTIFLALTNREWKQKDLAKKLSKNNSTISKSLNRGAYFEILRVIDYYKQNINQCLI
ncbi:MAG: transcriptional regulator [Marinifilaceae bacterium]|jgi:hypothetical protein|nr:transcriptional regulator [Marinifilaceae bacterium]